MMPWFRRWKEALPIEPLRHQKSIKHGSNLRSILVAWFIFLKDFDIVNLQILWSERMELPWSHDPKAWSVTCSLNIVVSTPWKNHETYQRIILMYHEFSDDISDEIIILIHHLVNVIFHFINKWQRFTKSYYIPSGSLLHSHGSHGP
jgi:hypothetical protein